MTFDSSTSISPTLIFEWDTVTWGRALPLWREALSAGGGKALELGARRGGPSLWLALNGYEVVCSDIENPAPTATALHRAHGVTGRIRYEAVDAANIPYEAAFDVILFKSILGVVGSHGRDALMEEAVRQMYKALRPGGHLLFAENLAGSPLHRWLRRTFVPWGKSWNYLRPDRIAQLMAPFSEVRWQTVGFSSAFGPTESFRRILGHLDRALDRFVPASWRYVVVGVARK